MPAPVAQAQVCLTPTARGWVPLDGGSFERIVIASPRPVAVVFWGPDCWPCQILGPTLACTCRSPCGYPQGKRQGGAGTGEQAVAMFGNQVTFAALDIAQSPKVAARFGVQGIPHLLFFAHGNASCHFIGEIPWVYLRDKLERALSLQSPPSQTSHPRFTRPSQNSA